MRFGPGVVVFWFGQIDPKKSGPTAGSSNTAQKIEHQIEDVANDAIDYKKK
jgi:hypothetical protein